MKKRNKENSLLLKDNSIKFNKEELEEAINKEVKRTRRLRSSKIINSKLNYFLNKKSSLFIKGKIWPILVPFFIVAGFLIVLPLVTMIIYSFIEPTNNSLIFKINFQNFVKMFTSKGVVITLLLSIAYAFCAAILSIIVGYPIAFILSNVKSKILAKNMWVLVTMPIWISMLLKTIGLQSLFYMLMPTVLGTPFAIIIGMVYMFLPFAIMPIYDALESRQLDLEEAAKDLGMSSFKTFWNIIFRSSLPGILTAFSLVIIQASTSLIVIKYMGIGKETLIVSIIESYFFKGNNFGYGAAISFILTLFIFLLTLVIKLMSNRLTGDKRKKWKNSSEQTILPL